MGKQVDSITQTAPVVFRVPVRFAETDAMGVVHHSNFIVWFEAGRIAWLDAVGVPYTEIAAGGHHFSVTGVQAEYRAPARFGDVVCIETRVDRLRSRQVSFVYTIRRQSSNDLLVTGRSDHICVDLEGRMAKIPDGVMERLLHGAETLAEKSGAT